MGTPYQAKLVGSVTTAAYALAQVVASIAHLLKLVASIAQQLKWLARLVRVSCNALLAGGERERLNEEEDVIVTAAYNATLNVVSTHGVYVAASLHTSHG